MFESALQKLERYIIRNDLNYSSVREVILREIYEAEKGLCTDEIHKQVNDKVHKKVSYNTIYRALRLFEACEIVITIQSNAKKTHYFLADRNKSLYLFDVYEHQVSSLEPSAISQQLLKELNLDKTDSFVVVHKY